MDLAVVASLRDIKLQISELNTQVKALEVTKHELETSLMSELDDSNTTLARTEIGTVAVTTATVPNVEDWVAFEKYVYENNALYLLQRQVSAPAYRDEVESKGQIPGIAGFQKRRLSLTGTKK
tara:strand:- start:23023 stop:23391 length:369 start_codon:yes stop_codon:yes gene_type:complete